MTEANPENQMSKFEKKRELARKLLIESEIKDIYYNMLNNTIIIDKLKKEHSIKFFVHYNAIEKWLDNTNTEYYCKISYQSFLYDMKEIAEECEVIYFGIALIEPLGLNLKDIKSKYIRFFSIYNIPIDFSFYNKFKMHRKEILKKDDQSEQT